MRWYEILAVVIMVLGLLFIAYLGYLDMSWRS